MVDDERIVFVTPRTVENARHLGNIPADNYLPERLDTLNVLSDTPKGYTASRPCVIRPSFVGRTVQDGTPSPDSPAPIKGVLNPWVAAYTGEPVQVTADVAPMMVLTDGTADRIVLRDGVWGIERYYKSIILTEDTSNVYAQADRLDITPLPSPPKNNGDAVSTHSSAFGMWNVVGGGQGMCSFDLVFPTQDAWKSYAKSQREAGTPITIWYRLDTPTFDPIPAWKGYGKIDPITVTTTITKPNPDAPISPDNVATITRTPVVTTGYRGAVKQLMAELFDGDSFDGTNLIAGDAITRHNLDIPLTPGNWTIEAGDDNGLLESTSVEVLPDPATYGNRIYPYQHTKVGNVHQLKGTPGAVEISFAATAPYLDGDTWTINGAPVAATYADGQALLPAEVIAGESVRAVLEGDTLRLLMDKPTPQKNLLDNADFRKPVNQRELTIYHGPGYTIDRWLLWSAETSITLKDGYIELSPAGNAGESALVQFIGSQATYAGTYTFTVEAEGYVCLDYYDDVFRSRRIYAGESGKRSVIAFVYNIDGDVIKQGNRVTIINPSTTESIKIYRVKLEPGHRFTGQYEQKPGETLAECQRYMLAFRALNRIRAMLILTDRIDFFIPTPVSLRIMPTIAKNSMKVITVNTGSVIDGFTFSVFSLAENGIIVSANKVAHGLSDAVLQIATNAAESTVLDANIY